MVYGCAYGFITRLDRVDELLPRVVSMKRLTETKNYKNKPSGKLCLVALYLVLASLFLCFYQEACVYCDCCIVISMGKPWEQIHCLFVD